MSRLPPTKGGDAPPGIVRGRPEGATEGDVCRPRRRRTRRRFRRPSHSDRGGRSRAAVGARPLRSRHGARIRRWIPDGVWSSRREKAARWSGSKWTPPSTMPDAPTSGPRMGRRVVRTRRVPEDRRAGAAVPGGFTCSTAARSPTRAGPSASRSSPAGRSRGRSPCAGLPRRCRSEGGMQPVARARQ